MDEDDVEDEESPNESDEADESGDDSEIYEVDDSPAPPEGSWKYPIAMLLMLQIHKKESC